jgi:hypothetical protein
MNLRNFPQQVSTLHGQSRPGWRCPSNDLCSLPLLDWNDSETDLAHLAGAAPGSAKSGGDKLWEDNWDDDDIEDEFSVQLRCVLGFDLQSILF